MTPPAASTHLLASYMGWPHGSGSSSPCQVLRELWPSLPSTCSPLRNPKTELPSHAAPAFLTIENVRNRK